MNVEELTFVSNNFMNIHTVLIEQCPVVRKICFQDNTFSYSEHDNLNHFPLVRIAVIVLLYWIYKVELNGRLLDRFTLFERNYC